MNHIFKRFLFYFGALVFIFSCSNESNNKKSPIVIKSINASQVINRAPKENDFQVDISLSGIMSEQNMNQDILYDWFIEYVNIDIDKENSLAINEEIKDDKEKESPNSNKNFLKDYYFLDISKESLNALLSVYKNGYYKVTLQASNTEEVKEYTIILKIGEPILPELYVKVNIPDIYNSKTSNFKGRFFLSTTNGDKINPDIINCDAVKMKSDWYNTGLEINPFDSFSINAGTHVLSKKTPLISSINNEEITYYFDLNNKEQIKSSPIIFKNISNANPLFITKSSTAWADGELYVSFLLWQTDENNKDKFNYFEKVLNNSNNTISANLKDSYISKIFIGSFGIKGLSNKYYVYFGPEGTDIDELDPKYQRDFKGLPYGYLIGKLGVDGKPFAIGNYFNYKYKSKYQIYKLDSNNNFVIIQ